MKKTLLCLLFLCATTPQFAQVVVGYFPFQSLVSVSSNVDKRVFAELKLETNTFFSNLNTELSPKVNIKRGPQANYYVGAGISINPANAFGSLPLTNGYLMDVGVRLKPIEKYKAFQVVFELSPYLNRTLNGGNLRSRLGVAFSF
jgi:hypothetical protein